MGRCEVKKIGNEYKIIGNIDESFGQFNSQIPTFGKVEINLKDLKSINSSGIREWIKLMLKMKPAQVYFYECPKVFIDQVNMVQGFCPENAKIMSFYVPYFNDQSESEKNVLFVHGQHYVDKKIQSLPKVVDDKGAEMEIDVVEAKYFRFIKG